MKKLILIFQCTAALVFLLTITARAQSYSSTKDKPANLLPGAPMDEAMGGRTLLGTPVSKRTEHCFPAESEDVFWQMDQAAGADGQVRPLSFDADRDGRLSEKERDAIRGRNTWLLWGGG